MCQRHSVFFKLSIAGRRDLTGSTSDSVITFDANRFVVFTSLYDAQDGKYRNDCWSRKGDTLNL